MVLLDMGYSSPIKSVENIISKKNRSDLLQSFFFYSEEYDSHIKIKPAKWEQLLMVSNMKTVERIFVYLYQHNIIISEDALYTLARTKAKEYGKGLLKSTHFITYAAKYLLKTHIDMNASLYNSNNYFKIWYVRVVAEAKRIDAIPFLVNILSTIDNNLTNEAYSALIAITGLDPAKKLHIQIYDPKTLFIFLEYYKNNQGRSH